MRVGGKGDSFVYRRASLKPSSCHDLNTMSTYRPGLLQESSRVARRRTRARGCESYACLPRGPIRKLMVPFWPYDASFLHVMSTR